MNIRTLIIAFILQLLFHSHVHPVQAQSNWFHYETPVQMPWQSNVCAVFQLPADSLKHTVYNNSWNAEGYHARTPLYTVTHRQLDSLFRLVEPGYYLIISAQEGYVKFNIRRKAAFNANIFQLHELGILDVTGMDGRPITDVTVTLQGKPLPYNKEMEGYILDVKGKDTLALRKGQDVEYYYCEKKKFVPYTYRTKQSREERRAERKEKREQSKERRRNKEDKNQDAFKGYLVTNKPKYLPGDTIKYKGYVLYEKKKKPVEEDLQLHVHRYQNYHLGKIKPQAPGVYYGEFILGDSIRPGQIYTLELKGDKYGSLTQQFVVEDYVLDETQLKVKGEQLRYYQQGDSVHLYAFAQTTNGLPVLDGQISITVSPSYTNVKDKLTFVPDTLYHATVSVNPQGDTYIGFSTQSFPDTKELRLNCRVSLINSNFESRDTSFTIMYGDHNDYLRLTEQNNALLAEYISHKKSVPAKGYYIGEGGKRTEVTYPVTILLDAYSHNKTFYVTDTAGKTLSSEYYRPGRRAIQVFDDYVGDTAYLQILNPKKVNVRYTLYEANNMIDYGAVKNDTIFRVYSRNSETISLVTQYNERSDYTNSVQNTYTAGKLRTKMFIEVKKKDIIYPGQVDTIGISLKDGDNNGIANTNVTVLAFSAKFKEDFTPQLMAAGLIKPGITHPRYSKSYGKAYMNEYRRDTFVTRAWSKLLQLDSVAFYRDIYLNPANVAHYLFDIPGSPAPQLAVYLHSKGLFLKPEIIYVDYKPAYIRDATVTTNEHALFVTEGIHNVSIRTADANYVIGNVQVCDGVKTNLFVNVDSILAINKGMKKGYGAFITKQPLSNKLSNDEKQSISSHLFAYRREQFQLDEMNSYEPLTIIQGLSQFNHTQSYSRYSYGYNTSENYDYGRGNGWVVIGPVDYNDSLSFFQYRNTKMRLLPERNFLYTIRKDMQRLERIDISKVVGDSLRGGTHTPLYNTIAKAPLPFDSLEVMPKPVPVVEPKIKMPQSTFLVKANCCPQNVPCNARLQLNRHIQVTPKYLVFRSEADLHEPIISVNNNYPREFSLVAGKYDIWYIWTDSTASVYKNINVQCNGQTYLPKYDTIIPFSMASPPKWLIKYISVRYDDNGMVTSQQYEYKGNGTYGALRAILLDDTKQPIKGATVQLLKGEQVKATAVTDEEGMAIFKPLRPGKYNIDAIHKKFRTSVVNNIAIVADRQSDVTISMKPKSSELEEVNVVAYKVPLIDKYNGGSRASLSSEEIEKMPTRTYESVAVTAPGVYSGSGGLSMGGARTDGTQYIVDGIQVRGANGVNMAAGGIDMPMEKKRKRDEKLSSAEKTTEFMATFLENMQAASGIRKDFRDWAIWEPNLWTNSDGVTGFSVTYPDDITAWKTYVLAMNPKGFAGRSYTLTQAFKPLAAELSTPRFMRYGDTAVLVGKLMNYTPKPFSVSTSFLYNNEKKLAKDILVTNAKVAQFSIAAPANNILDTTYVLSAYTLKTENGYSDGEERSIPVYPVGLIESKGECITMMHDTSIYSRPSDNSGHFTGKTRIYIDGSVLEVMLHEIEGLKVYPHGCTEQLTSKLLAIYYEEAVKELLGIDTLNNKKEKKEIVDKLINAQNRDGSFGWFGGNSTDYRVTNYVISTLHKVNKDGWLDYIIRRGLTHLDANLANMQGNDLIAALSTLSSAKHSSQYEQYLNKLDMEDMSIYNRLAVIKIRKEQGLSYRGALDTVMRAARQKVNGLYWSNDTRDWYRNDLAATLLAYQVIKDDSVYGDRKNAVMNYILFKRMKGHYTNTAESGLVLSTILPKLMQPGTTNKDKKTAGTSVYIAGSLKDTVTRFPAHFEVSNKKPEFYFQKKGLSPAYVSVVYDHFNTAPMPKDGSFKVHTSFVKNGDTVTGLKQGDRVTLWVQVQSLKDAEYVMVDVPIPAGCMQSDAQRAGGYESHRENYKDHTVIYCRDLPLGTYWFPVNLQVRYKGNYNISPAMATMMYYPDEYGNNGVKKVRID